MRGFWGAIAAAFAGPAEAAAPAATGPIQPTEPWPRPAAVGEATPQAVPVAAIGDPDWVAILRAAGFGDPIAWARLVEAPARRWSITAGKRAAAFAATLSHESTGGRRLVEDLTYSTGALMAMFGAHRGMTPEAARRLGYMKDSFGRITQRADQEGIANLIYGGDWGRRNLGNVLPGDGWLFRGRGPIQITGRDAYRRAGEAIGQPLVVQPDLAADPAIGAEVACWVWAAWKRCNALADAGDVVAWRKAINGGTNGLEEVRRLYAAALRVAG